MMVDWETVLQGRFEAVGWRKDKSWNDDKVTHWSGRTASDFEFQRFCSCVVRTT